MRCPLNDIVSFLENLEKWSLNFGRGVVVGAKSRGEDTCHGVVFKSSLNLNKPNYLMVLVEFVVDTMGL
jgi:hypothetical protein